MTQPEILAVDSTIRLRTVNATDIDAALPWYQDADVLKGTGGPGRTEPYDRTTVVRMYEYLAGIGECYMIEIREDSLWIPIGDVTLAETTMPIVIGNKAYWNRGIGKRVIMTLLNRARDLGFKKIALKEIYFDNERSLRLFQACGFRVEGKTEDGWVLEIHFG